MQADAGSDRIRWTLSFVVCSSGQNHQVCAAQQASCPCCCVRLCAASCTADMQPAQPELYNSSNFPVFILQEESGDSPGSNASSSSSGSSDSSSGNSSNGSSDSSDSSRFVAAASVPRPCIEPAGSSGVSDLGLSPHDVRPLHGGAAFYGFPSFGGKPGGSGPATIDRLLCISHVVVTAC
jgi:hypothetical protein